MSHSRALERTCGCFGGRRRAPLRVHGDVVEQLLRILGPAVAVLADQVVVDYRCPDCKQIVVYTLREFLQPPNGS